MTLSLEEFYAKHPLTPAEREAVNRRKEELLAQSRAYRLRELREMAGLTQTQVAERIGVGQRQVSKIERGELDSARISTIRKYMEAIGGSLSVEYILDDHRIRVA